MNENVFIALGSNIEPRLHYLKNAIELIGQLDETIINAKSFLYESQPIGNATDVFYNAAIRLKTNLSPLTLMKHLLTIEEKLGRVRTIKGGNRIIDCDLLFFNDAIISSIFLCLPHPEIQNRDFVLRPLKDIDPIFIHPVFKKNVKTLLEELALNTSLKQLHFNW